MFDRTLILDQAVVVSKWLAAVFLLLSGLSACQGREQGTSAIQVVDSAGVEIVTNDLSRLDGTCSVPEDPRLRLGDRPGDPAHELYRVFGATLLSDGRVAVVDQGSQQLRFYAPDGSFLFGSGGEGEGPGEFRSAFLLWRFPGDTIWVGDYRPWEFEVFAPDGEWVRAVRPQPPYPNPPRAYGVLSDGRAVLGTEDFMDRSPDFQAQPIYLLLHDRTGALVDTVRTVPNGRFGKTVKEPDSPWLYPWFESFAEVSASGDRLLLGHGSEAELQMLRVGAGLEVETILRWTGQNRTVTEADVAAAEQAIEERFAHYDANMRRRMVEPLIHEDRPVADQMPAFINVMTGTDESIWIKEYPRPGNDPRASWVRFGPEGRFRCFLDLSQDFEVYEFGPDYVVGKEEGEAGIEVVAVYDLLGGGE